MAGYWVVRIEVTDMEPYLTYAKQTADVAAQFGGRFLVKGGAMEQKEGSGPERIVLIEFPSVEKAQACYQSGAYQAILPIALENSVRDLAIVEGV